MRVVAVPGGRLCCPSGEVGSCLGAMRSPDRPARYAFPAGEERSTRLGMLRREGVVQPDFVSETVSDSGNHAGRDGWASDGRETGAEGRGVAVVGHLEVWTASGRTLLPLGSSRSTVGSSAESDLVIDDPSVSRTHLLLEQSGRSVVRRGSRFAQRHLCERAADHRSTGGATGRRDPPRCGPSRPSRCRVGEWSGDLVGRRAAGPDSAGA